MVVADVSFVDIFRPMLRSFFLFIWNMILLHLHLRPIPAPTGSCPTPTPGLSAEQTYQR